MTDRERLSLLYQAEQNIIKVSDSLNDKSSHCEHCGLTVYDNFGHHAHIQALTAAINRVQKVRRELAGVSDSSVVMAAT
jgi:hypothetical protein